MNVVADVLADICSFLSLRDRSTFSLVCRSYYLSVPYVTTLTSSGTVKKWRDDVYTNQTFFIQKTVLPLGYPQLILHESSPLMSLDDGVSQIHHSQAVESVVLVDEDFGTFIGISENPNGPQPSIQNLTQRLLPTSDTPHTTIFPAMHTLCLLLQSSFDISPWFSASQRLRRIYLLGLTVDTADVAVRFPPSLEIIELSHCKVTNQCSAIILDHCPHLHTLALYETQFVVHPDKLNARHFRALRMYSSGGQYSCDETILERLALAPDVCAVLEDVYLEHSCIGTPQHYSPAALQSVLTQSHLLKRLHITPHEKFMEDTIQLVNTIGKSCPRLQHITIRTDVRESELRRHVPKDCVVTCLEILRRKVVKK
eukprot:PhF_6_TR43091/c2_g1_i1/m.65813